MRERSPGARPCESIAPIRVSVGQVHASIKTCRRLLQGGVGQSKVVTLMVRDWLVGPWLPRGRMERRLMRLSRGSLLLQP